MDAVPNLAQDLLGVVWGLQEIGSTGKGSGGSEQSI